MQGNSVTDASVDTNTSATTTAFKTNGGQYASLLIKPISGTHGTHVVTILVSENGTDWHSTTHTKTGTGVLEGVLVIGKYITAKVSTVEGAASVCDIALIIR